MRDEGVVHAASEDPAAFMRAQALAAISQPAPVRTATPPPPPPPPIVPLVTPAPPVPQVNPAHPPAPRPPQSPRPQTNLSAPRLSTIYDSSEEDVQLARRKLAELDDSSSSSSDKSTEDGRTAVQVVRRRPVDIIRRPRPVARGTRPVPAKGDRLMDPPCEQCVKNGRECWTRRHGISACWDCGKMKMKCIPAARDAAPGPAGSQSTRAAKTARQRQGKRHAAALTSDEESLAETSDSERPALIAEGKRPEQGVASGSEFGEHMIIDIITLACITRQQARAGEPAPAPGRSTSPPRLSRA